MWGESAKGTWVASISDCAASQVGLVTRAELTVHGDLVDKDSVYVFTDDYGVRSGTEQRVLNDPDGGIDRINTAASPRDVYISLVPAATGNMINGRPFSIDKDTVIEELFCGDGDDTLIGNNAANTLSGGNGKDVLHGSKGVRVLRSNRHVHSSITNPCGNIHGHARSHYLFATIKRD